MSAVQVVLLITIVGWLFLATRTWQSRSRGLTFEAKAAMVAVGIVLFVVIAVAAQHFGGGPIGPP